MYRYAYTYSVTKELWKWWKHLSRLLSSCSPCNTVCMVYAYITSAHTSSYNANQAANPTCPHIFWIAVYHWQSNSQTIDTQIARISFIRNQFTRRLVLTSSIRTDKCNNKSLPRCVHPSKAFVSDQSFVFFQQFAPGHWPGSFFHDLCELLSPFITIAAHSIYIWCIW